MEQSTSSSGATVMAAQHIKIGRRMRRAFARRTRISFPRLLALAAVPLLLVSSRATAQQGIGETINGAALSGSGLEIFNGASAKSTAASPGTGLSEVLRGNGSRVGYKLSHGNVITNTVRVRSGGRILRLDADYWIDPGSGSLIFAQAVRSSESISVYYRYLDGPAASGSALGVSGLQLNFGGGASLGLTYNTIAGDGSGYDTSLYGLSLGGKVGGGGIGSFSGLAYFSNTQASTNLVTSAVPTGPEASKPKTDTKTGMDHLLTQNFALNSGKFGFHADYQDVGKGFAGFQALKAANSNNKDMLAQLTALEGEKGVRRLGFGLNLANDLKSKSTSGLSLQWNKIEDGAGSISQQAIAYSAGALHLNYSTRDIGATFGAFKGLREADKAQMEKEKGLKTTTIGFGLGFGANKKGLTAGGFDFASKRFADASGSLSRDLISLNTGGLGFSLLNRRSDVGFKRFADLSEEDKGVLALDLYRQFDPVAKIEQVTAADRAQIVKETGFARSAMRLDDRFGKTGYLGFSQFRVANKPTADPTSAQPAKSDQLTRDSFELNTTQFSLNFTSRKADPGFNRIADLADVEKNNLALDTRRQFDPLAKLEQVTQKDRDQLAKESGIERTNLRGRIGFGKDAKSGALTFSQFRIADLPASLQPSSSPPVPASRAIEGALLGYADRNFQLNYTSKTIGSGFNRMADLSDVDRLQFANARGLSQHAFNGLWQIGKVSKLTFAGFDARGTGDAIASAVAAATAANTDVAAAAKYAQSGFNHISAAFETKGLSLSAGQGKTDREFDRASDLPITDAEKHQIEMERGTKRTDYALHFARVKGLTVDGTFYGADDSEQKRNHKLEKINAQYAVNKKINLGFQTDADLTTLQGKKTGTDHTVITLNQEIGRNFLLNLLHDANAVYDADTPTPLSATTNALHFESPKTKKNNLQFDVKRIAFLDGKYENSTNLILHAKPSSSLCINYSRQEIDRGSDNKDTVTTPGATDAPKPVVLPSETTDSLDGQWQATKQFAIVFGFSQRETTDNTNGDTVSIGLQGDPVKNVTLTAKFDEVHTNGKNTKDVADFAFSNKKPFQLGCIRDLTVTARYASLNDQRKLQNETMAGRASWNIWKNEFILDYGGLTKQNGEVTISRLYSFTTDPNPKKWFHGGFFYKVRTMIDGTENTIRRFTADWRLNKNTNFVYTFGTLPEDDKGNIIPQTKADVSFKHTIRQDLSFEAYYRMFADEATKKMTRSLGFGFENRLNRTTKLALAYSVDALMDSALYDHSNHYHFLLDHQVDADHFLTLSSEIRSHDGKDLKDDIRANLDFRIIF